MTDTIKYQPDRSDRDAVKLCRRFGIALIAMSDGTWCWHDLSGGAGNDGFPTKYHAAADALLDRM